METVLLLIRLARPLFLLGGVLLYALGAGIARYLGAALDWNLYLLGQVWVILLQLGAQFLNEYYDAERDAANDNRTYLTGGSGMLGEGRLPRRTALLAGLTTLAFLASLTAVMIGLGRLPAEAYLIMGLAFVGSFFYSSPPLRLQASGYGEMTTSILVAYLVPAYAFVIQNGELHRLVALSTLGLTVLHMAMLMAFSLPDYATDLKYNKQTLMVRLGWERGMQVHNLLILGGFLMLGVAGSFGLPAFVMLPALLTLPLGLLQIWQMRQIANGKKPNWNALTLNALAVFAATAYMITYAFWTN